MKQLEVFKKIGGILNELHEQYKYIETNPENINDLELELFVANAHFLTDHAEILNKLNQRNKAESATAKAEEKVTQQLPPHVVPAELPQQVQQPTPPPIVETPPIIEPLPVAPPPRKNTAQVERALEKIKALTSEKFFEPMVQQPKREVKPAEPAVESVPEIIDITPPPTEHNYSFEIEQPEVIRHELVMDETEELDEEEEIQPEVTGSNAAVTESNATLHQEANLIETPIIKEDAEERIAIELGKDPVIEPAKPELKIDAPVKEKDEVFTINQRISAQLGNANNVAEQAHAQPITNLKQAITLNDKLLYIKDLFNGYSLAYSEAIEILNRFNTFEEANRFLSKNYTTKNNWDSKPETTNKFFALLKRRYS